jgi:translation initiation factor 2 beta subunit (eIF-2beta)/eIF-5
MTKKKNTKEAQKKQVMKDASQAIAHLTNYYVREVTIDSECDATVIIASHSEVITSTLISVMEEHGYEFVGCSAYHNIEATFEKRHKLNEVRI